MATTNPFLFAHLEKVDLNKKTIKDIQKVYKASAMDIEKKLASLKMLHPSDSLKKIYFENLLKDINKSSDSFNRMIQNTIISAGETSGKIAVDAGVKYMESVGLSIKGAYSYIPRQEIMNIASGKVYGKHWSLSKAIWNADSKKKSDIQNIVAKGLAENKSIKSISDDLMKYVDPSARKPWDWSKVYPGTSAKVDYNAQRLARTMIQHSFQNSLVQSQKDNPFCKGIIWHSVFIEGRTCEICEARDGEVFDVNKLPLDHPNGLCYFEPELDKMDKVADRLADWVEGKPDPELDNYVAKAFGFSSPKVPLGKSVVDRTKEKTAQELARRETTRAKRVVKPNKNLKPKQPKHKIVEGKDISTTWVRRPGKFDFEIEDVINAQGFDGKPRVVSAKEFEAAVKDSKFIAQRTYTAESQEILEAYRKQLYEGRWYVDCGTGGAQYGQGMYCAADYTGTLSEGIKAEMRHYQGLGADRFGKTLSKEEWIESALKIAKSSGYTDDVTRTWIRAYAMDDIPTAEKLLKSGKISETRADKLNDILHKVPKKSAPSYTETLTLDSSAKIVKYDDLYKEFSEYKVKSGDRAVEKFISSPNLSSDVKTILRGEFFPDFNDFEKSLEAYNRVKAAGEVDIQKYITQARKLKQEAEMKASQMNIGSYATAKGYDAINAVGHGKSGSYTVILNRTKVIIKRP